MSTLSGIHTNISHFSTTNALFPHQLNVMRKIVYYAHTTPINPYSLSSSIPVESALLRLSVRSQIQQQVPRCATTQAINSTAAAISPSADTSRLHNKKAASKPEAADLLYKMAAHRPPNMISISKSSLKVHSQYLQYLALFLMEHPILKILGWLAIIKLQKRSESNVLTNFSSYRNRRLSK